jgi:integrase
LYYEYQQDKVKATTIKTYKDRIPYMKMLDNIKVKDLDGIHYELWRKEIAKLPVATSYKNDIQKFIKIVLNWASRMYGYNFQPFYNKIVKFQNPNEIKKEMDFYTIDEFKQLISYENDIIFKCLFETLYYCGLRRGEARALTWNDLNFAAKTLRVNKNCITIGSESSDFYEITTPKTQSSNRIIPMPNQLIDDLKILYSQVQKYEGFKKEWFVFGSNLPIKNSKMRVHKNSLCDKAGLRRIRLHDFRHSCASLLINNGANITLVAKYLGHTKIDETLNTYSHMYESKLNDIVNTINNLS